MTGERRVRGRATIIDVALAAQVSRQTVSNVVNAPAKVAPETLARVNREIDRLGFRPNRAARTLKQERAGAWGLELNERGIARPGSILDEFLFELTRGSPDHDSHIVPFVAPDSQAPVPAYEDMLASRIADGFVLTDTRHDDPRPAWLLANDIPFASFGRVWDDPSVTHWVDVDGSVGTEAAVRHLVQTGYRRIGFLGWPEGSPVGDDRRTGWLRTATELDVGHPAWQAVATQELTEAAAAATPLIDHVGHGGALVCASDVLAVGAWQVLAQRGWRTGQDFALVGFDDTDLAASLGLTSLRQPLATVAERVLHLIGTWHTEPAPTGGLLLDPELVVRASSSPAGDRTS